jgi:hypothetical protein
VRLKLKFLLPSLQILLAVVLYWQSDAWNQAQRRISDMPGPDPAFTLLVAINFPAALVRAFVLAPLPEVWNRAFFIGSIGLLWYWLVLEYQSWRKRREAFTFTWNPLRVFADLLLIAIGMLCGLYALDNILQLRAFVHGEIVPQLLIFPKKGWGWPWFIATEGLYFAWFVGLSALFGRDLLLLFRRSK